MSIRSLKNRLASALALVILALPVLAVQPTSAQVSEENKDAACAGITSVGGSCDDGAAGESVSNVVADVVNILSWVVGVVAVIMIIVGGFRYVTSGGDSNSTSAAKNTILYAIIGLVVAALAQALVHFVLRQTTT